MSDVIVTGGAGFIGSATTDLLLENGYTVAIVDDMSTGKKVNVNPDATLYELDIRDAGLNGIFAKEKPRYVIHNAAQIDVRKSITDPAYDASVNVNGTINLLEAARKHSIEKLVFSSSGGAVYGEPESNPVSESHPIRPLCPYGASKYCGEKYIEMYGATHGLKYNIMRYGNVYGPRQDPLGEAGVVAIFTKKIADGVSPVIFGDGCQTRDFCFVGDIAAANLSALRSEGSDIFNVGSGVPTSVNEITAMLIESLGQDLEPSHSDAVAGEIRHIYLDISLISSELGWKPKVGMEEGIGMTTDWFLGSTSSD